MYVLDNALIIKELTRLLICRTVYPLAVILNLPICRIIKHAHQNAIPIHITITAVVWNVGPAVLTGTNLVFPAAKMVCTHVQIHVPLTKNIITTIILALIRV